MVIGYYEINFTAAKLFVIKSVEIPYSMLSLSLLKKNLAKRHTLKWIMFSSTTEEYTLILVKVFQKCAGEGKDEALIITMRYLRNT